jgi:hypothetical protein
MSEEDQIEEGGTVEEFTVPPTLTIPKRTIVVEVIYVTPAQLDQIQSDSRESSDLFGFWTCALGIVVSFGVAIATIDHDFSVKHPYRCALLWSLLCAALLWGISQFVHWMRKRNKVSSIIKDIKTAQQTKQR